MNDEWAAENLRTIRTLMERAVIYRRALAPVMTLAGVLGMIAAVTGWKAGIVAPAAFVLYWMGVAVVTGIAGLLLIRRQALREGEAFWSAPTRRVSRALFPTLFAGAVVGAAAAIQGLRAVETPSPAYFNNVCVPLIWVVLYGSGVHAAGFFMQRGIRRFGWTILVLGCLGFLGERLESALGWAASGYLIMGFVFGLHHLLYGIYLFATEKPSATE